MNAPTSSLRAAVAAIAVALASAAPLAAQNSDFLFKTPLLSLGVHAGYAGASAGSDIFDWTRSQLTVDRSDFNSGLIGLDIGIRASERVDVALGVEYMTSEVQSEYREWVGADDLPVAQSTDFTRTPISLSLKYFLNDRGRSIGRFAWVPVRRFSPYVGAGAGWTWYQFKQSGEWIDFESDPDFPEIFTGRVVSDGYAPSAHVLGGMELSLSPRFTLTGEGRYTWSSTKLDRDFQGFDKIDLGGFQFTLGLAARL